MMHSARDKRPYSIQRDFRVLEREQRVTKVLGSDAFRAELEDILQSQLKGTRSPPKSRALHSLQTNVAPVAEVEAAHKHASSLPGPASAVLPINDLRGVLSSRYTLAERQLRCKLASLCRLVDWFGWSQLVNNHVSARGAGERDQFLMNPFGLLYSEVTASSLVMVNDEGDILDSGSTQLGINGTGFELHSTIYRTRRDVKCVMHLHTVAGAAVSVMNCGLLPLSQEALSVGKVSYCNVKKHLTEEQERKKFVRSLGKNKVLILQNHGLVAMGSCVEECFHLMHSLIQACQIQVAALAAGIANLIQVTSEEECGKEEQEVGGAKVWRRKGEMEFEALMRMLDNKGYNTGYNYCGLSLLQSGPSITSKQRRVGEGVVQDRDEERGGERQTLRGGRNRRRERVAGPRASGSCSSDGETQREQDGQVGVWSFLEDDRSRTDRPLTKNTKIGWRSKEEAQSGSPVQEKAQSRDPWQFLDSTEGRAQPVTKDNIHNGMGAQGDTTASPQHHTSASGSVVTEKTTPTSSMSQSHQPGRRKRRKKKPSHSTPSPPPPPLADHAHSPPGLAHSPATLSPPPHLTPLQLAQYTAERVAESTGKAVQKLALKRLTPEPPERTLSEPNLSHAPRQWAQLRVKHVRPQHVDSQGYSSGDEDSHMETGQQRATGEPASTNGAIPTSVPNGVSRTSPRSTLSGLERGGSPSHEHNRTTHSPHAAHTSPLHEPANISYPDGCSSAEKAAYTARIVADSTGSAVQKLTDSLSDRLALSFSSGTHSSFPSISSPLPDN